MRMDDLSLPMQQVVASDESEIRLGGHLEQQLGGSRNALRDNTDRPDVQVVEAGLQLGPQHKSYGRTWVTTV